MNGERGDIHGEHPGSDLWVEYYSKAQERRRARGPELRTRVKLRKHRQRQLAMMISGFLTVGAIALGCYVVLVH